MKTPILNRDFKHPADGWYQIEVPGEHKNKDAGVTQVIDAEAVDSIVNTFNREAAEAGADYPGMLIDREHFKHDPDKETTAYGWLMKMRNRKGIPEGQIRWSGTGQTSVDQGDYRFFSSEYDPKDLVVLNDKKPRRVRPMRLDGLTLTNMPNNKGGRPITNRDSMNKNENSPDPIAASKAANAMSKSADADGSPALHQSAADAHQLASDCHNDAAKDAAKEGDTRTAKMHAQIAAQHDVECAAHAAAAKGDLKNRNTLSDGLGAGGDSQKQNTPIEMKTVIAKLGLPADASEEAVLAEVTKIHNRVATLETAQVESDLETFKDTIPAADREAIKGDLLRNRESTLRLLRLAVGATSRTARTATAPQRLHNRGNTEQMEAEQAELDAAEGDQIKLNSERNEAVADYKIKNRCSHETAWNAVRRAKPELFGLTKEQVYQA